jgi:hypothetical protein
VRQRQASNIHGLARRAHGQGQKNHPNVIRIVSREWLQWIKREGEQAARLGSKSIGFRK